MPDQTQSVVPVGQTTEPVATVGELTEPQSVAYETYLRTLDEAKKAKKRLKEFEDAEKVRTERELEEKGEYKKLLTERDGELTKLREQISLTEKKENDRLKLASILNAVDGEIDPKWYGLINYDSVIINPDSRKADEISVAKAVENLKKEFPEIITRPNGPRFPNAAPQSMTANRISRSEWLKLPSKDMTKWKLDQITD